MSSETKKAVHTFVIFLRGYGRLAFDDVGDNVVKTWLSVYSEAKKKGDWSLLFEIRDKGTGPVVFVAPIGVVEAVIDGMAGQVVS